MYISQDINHDKICLYKEEIVHLQNKDWIRISYIYKYDYILM